MVFQKCIYIYISVEKMWNCVSPKKWNICRIMQVYCVETFVLKVCYSLRLQKTLKVLFVNKNVEGVFLTLEIFWRIVSLKKCAGLFLVVYVSQKDLMVVSQVILGKIWRIIFRIQTVLKTNFPTKDSDRLFLRNNTLMCCSFRRKGFRRCAPQKK